MGISRRRFVGLGAAAGLAPHAHAILQPGPHDADDARSDLISDSVDWAEFLSRHDLLWDQIPHQWGDAPFLGNGRLAISVRGKPDDTTALWFSIDNSDVYDRRDESWGWTAYSQSRYHVGDLLLKPVGQLLGLQMRLSLYDGELTGTVTTSAGTIAFVAFVHPQRMVGVVNLTPSEGEQSCRWDWRAGEAVSSRTPIRNAVQQAQYQKSYGHPVKLWVDNPAAERSQSEGVDLCVQKLLARGAYATAWKETQSSGQGRTVFASCVMSWPGLESSQDSVSEVRSASAAGFQFLRDSNRLWWHTYYPASFLSIPDTQLESFYWIQMYKYGCAAPKQPGIIDTHGPWLQPTNWPYITWNLNTQRSYWALQPANRLKLADSLFRSLDAHPRVMSQNVAGFTTGDDLAALGHCSQQDLLAPFDADVRFEREWGNLLWVCHNYWLQYRSQWTTLCCVIGFFHCCGAP